MRLELNQREPHLLEVASLSLELAPYPNLLLLQLHWQSNCFFDYLWMKDFCFFLGRVTKMRKMNVTSITNPAVIFREAASSCSMEERAG